MNSFLRYTQRIAFASRCLLASLLLSVAGTSHANTVDTDLACGGALEQRIWKHWDSTAREHIKATYLDQRLFVQGDTYALYDLQTLLHNMVWMAERCGRSARLSELANFLRPVFARLEPLGDDEKSVAWICRGGLVCNKRNKLIDQEVRLVSSQGLGLLTTLAAAMARTGGLNEADRAFVLKTQSVAAQHMSRWLESDRQRSIPDGLRSLMRSGSGRSGGFSDLSMWHLVILSNLAAVDHLLGSVSQPLLTSEQRAQFSNAFQRLVDDFVSRIDTHPVPEVPHTTRADFDHDRWRTQAGNSFAGYEGDGAPARCLPGQEKPELLVEPDQFPAKQGIGWDISHSRRLVHVTLALELAQDALAASYGFKTESLKAAEMSERFANQVVYALWNRDPLHPLFANYWSGANGWYRVGYINGTGRCYPGTPPFGLSGSFPTGGFGLWSTKQPLIQRLGVSLLNLTESTSSEDRSFMRRYYPALAADPKDPRALLTRLMFWPTLVSAHSPMREKG